MSYYERNKETIKKRNLKYYYENKQINKQKFESLSEKEKQDIFNKRKLYQRNYWLKSKKIILTNVGNNTNKPVFDGFVRF